MFQLSAEQYDVLYSVKDYEREAHLLREHLSHLDPSLHTVLDVACGTGAHDEHLCRYYEVDGLDLKSEFVETARRRNQRGRYHVADMRDFRLDRLYDTVICLFGSIGYARSRADLVRTLTCCREHLTPRGVVVIEPWLTPDAFESPAIHRHHSREGEVTVVRMSRSTRRQDGADCVSVLDIHYLVGTPEGIDYSTETHELGLFTHRQMESALTEAGFCDIHHDRQGLAGRGLYTARVGRSNS
ncbi:MAG TPA: class I SAM-dependent methyltransferase [Candidatus Latescibacteria bacterium]|jgi:SAM-dependent methyltransferase|nr:SAM-dependent methyltransferase [Gemmatimonadaceae bacterium]MDP6015613.1 class I SAM-dependent methyltransferase [Candidatus Latescibacterota bacterium]HJP31198.1 class I SAM-dependent methyltransferase [Candidatus Latescibacterota bacterium]|tara:strand:- start:904 stop:1629 length:726 start_codon:yes stop_codon:yes gene_type:complete